MMCLSCKQQDRSRVLSIITAGSLIWSISFPIDRFKGIGVIVLED